VFEIPVDIFEDLYTGSSDRKISTTMAFVRILNLLLRNKDLKEKIVPIVPDESRTFGMEGLFRQIGIYSSKGQLYEPVDKASIMYYREERDGQLLQEGINEAGAMSSWISAATSYSTCSLSMIPMYIYYSMFGFQRVGDLLWAAGDLRAKGFLLGATSGRTTLAGEGLQHNDGQSQIMASLIPNCVSYDPCFSYELAVIIHHGIDLMYVKNKDVFFYITLMNENYKHPKMPEGAESGIVKGMYLYKKSKKDHMIHLLGSGAILQEVIKAAVYLEKEGVHANIWSVTSFTELAREAGQIERQRIYSEDKTIVSYLEQWSG
jgi:pyruvate dehydrogenase E1 component